MIENFHYSFSTIKRLFHPEFIPALDNSDFFFSSIVTSTKDVKPGSIFIPLKGISDGHRYIEESLEKGASGFLCEIDNTIFKKISKKFINQCIPVKNSLLALGELSRFHRNRFNPVVIGITGSSGKTTTKEILKSCLNFMNQEELVVTEKNYNNEIGLPFTLFKINQKTKIVICEMGMNHSGEISRLSYYANPSIAFITSIGTAHIEFFKNSKEIATAKLEIIDGMSIYSLLVLPKSINHFNYLSYICKKNKINLLAFDLMNRQKFKILSSNENGFVIQYQNQKITWPIPSYNVLNNVLGSIEILEKLNVTSNQIARGLRNYKPEGNRFKLEKGNYLIINDSYNANLDSMKSSIEAINNLAQDKNFYLILGDMKELGKFSKKLHGELGKYIQNFKNVKGIITIGKESLMIQKKIKLNLEFKMHFDSLENIKEISNYIHSKIPQKSFILIKGSRSMELEKIAEILV